MPIYYGDNPKDRPDHDKRPRRAAVSIAAPVDHEAEDLCGLVAAGFDAESIAGRVDVRAVVIRAIKRRDRRFFSRVAQAFESLESREDRGNEIGLIQWLRGHGLSYAEIAKEFRRITGEPMTRDAVRKRLTRLRKRPGDK